MMLRVHLSTNTEFYDTHIKLHINSLEIYARAAILCTDASNITYSVIQNLTQFSIKETVTVL